MDATSILGHPLPVTACPRMSACPGCASGTVQGVLMLRFCLVPLQPYLWPHYLCEQA